ncbi:MAG: hypothetical protein IJU98_11865, partial [Synergistaceae bacterium]|nr:hypothetical protein [Synergistaceae bacterium]
MFMTVDGKERSVDLKFTVTPYYKVTWKNEEGTVLKTTDVLKGATPSYGGTPTKAADEQYTYTFAGWSPTVAAANADTSYTATFSQTVRQYTVTWKNEDGTVLKTDTVDYGEIPSYDGAVPEKAAGEQCIYAFSGWTPEITAVTGNAEYIAAFTPRGAISCTVTFKVVNGSWDEGEGDAATADRLVTLVGYEGDTLKLSADQIPAVGSKPNNTYRAGNWDVTPDVDVEITADTAYTYTYAKMEAAVVIKAPAAKTLIYNGSAQALVTAGTASGGTMQYSLDGTNYSAAIPTGTNAGSYTVYYKVVADANHIDTTAQTVTVTISQKSSPDPTSAPTPGGNSGGSSDPAPVPAPAPTPTPTPEPEPTPTPEPEDTSALIGDDTEKADAPSLDDYLDGKTDAELEAVTELTIEDAKGLESLEGIENLTNL